MRDHLGVEPDAEARPQAPRAEAQARGARALRRRGRGPRRGGERGRDRADRAPRRRRDRRAGAAGRGLDACASGAGRRRLPHRRAPARGARDDARTLARRRPRQRRHAAPRRGRVRRGGGALGRLRRPARLEGAARLRRRDLPRPAAPVRRDAKASASPWSPTVRRPCTSSPSPDPSPSCSEPSGTGFRPSSWTRRTTSRRSRRAVRPSRSTSPWPGRSRCTSASRRS